MKLICALIKWGIRVAFFFFVMMPSGFDKEPTVFFILEILFSGLALSRFEKDQIFQVITGFGPLGDYGHYEYTDKSSGRCLGWLCWIIALLNRLILILWIVLTYFPDLIPKS